MSTVIKTIETSYFYINFEDYSFVINDNLTNIKKRKILLIWNILIENSVDNPSIISHMELINKEFFLVWIKNKSKKTRKKLFTK